MDPATDDPFFRYKMHQLCVQVIGRGKMIRTQFLNVTQVANDLKVPADYLPNFFAQNIGAKAAYDKKKPERERASISGEYSLEDLSNLLTTFVRKFVMCGSGTCSLPELSFVPLKKRTGVKCRSCGWTSYVDKMDLPHKFQRYVQNHPPPKTAHLDKNLAKKAEAVKKRRKADAKIMKMAEKLNVEDINEEDIEWGTDLSEAAQAQRAAEMVPDKLKDMVEITDEVKAVTDAPATPTVTKESLAENLSDVAKTLASVGTVDGVSAQASVLFDACFADLLTVGNEAKTHVALLAGFVSEQAAPAEALLNAWSSRVKESDDDTRAALKKCVPLHFKSFYDLDIIDEEYFLSWSSKQDESCALKTLGAPFLSWLEAADEESSEEEEA